MNYVNCRETDIQMMTTFLRLFYSDTKKKNLFACREGFPVKTRLAGVAWLSLQPEASRAMNHRVPS